jgi:hypothetical protein
MRWNIIVKCVGEDGEQSTIALGTIERLLGVPQRKTWESICRNRSRL